VKRLGLLWSGLWRISCATDALQLMVRQISSYRLSHGQARSCLGTAAWELQKHHAITITPIAHPSWHQCSYKCRISCLG
jgi:hypothetical protein